MSKHDPLELRYLAGFFDGEGCLTLVKNRDAIRPSMTVTNKDTRPLERFHATFGGTIHWDKRGTPQEIGRWFLQGKSIGVALLELRSHLVIKREQADILLAFYGAKDNLERQEELRAAVRALNARGRLRNKQA